MRRPSSDPVQQARVSRRITLALAKLAGLQAHFAKRVLCDADGNLTPDAERLIGLLAVEARINQRGFQPNADRRLFDAGAQHIVHLLVDWAGMDSAKLARAEQQLKDDLKG